MNALILIALISADVPSEVRQAKASFCTVAAPDGSLGSGVLLQGPIPWVATCYHVAGPKGSRVTCTFGARQIQGTVSGHNSRSDVSIIRLSAKPAARGVPIARYGVGPNERTYAVGFGGPNQPLSVHIGRYVQTGVAREDWFEITGTARSGDSGGPIVVVRKGQIQVVGVLWGTGGGRIIGSRLAILRKLFGMRIYRNETRNANSRPAVRPKLVPGSMPKLQGGNPTRGAGET